VNGGLFRCYQFNSAGNVSSSTTGFTGAVSMLFFTNSIPNEEKYEYARHGLQVTFSMPGETPRLMDETKYALPTLDTTFTISKVGKL
jgi:hypothetical protein